MIPAGSLDSLLAAAYVLDESLTADRLFAVRDELVPRLRRRLIRMWRQQMRLVDRAFMAHLRAAHFLESTPSPGMAGGDGADRRYWRGEISEADVPSNLLALLQILLDSDDSSWSEIFAGIIAEAAYAAGEQLATDFSLTGSFEKFPVARVVEEIKTNSLSLVRGINATTRGTIRTIIENGLEEHLSYSAVAKQIRDKFKSFGAFQPQLHIRDRATLVAVQEIGQAYTNAQKAIGASMVDAGLSMEKFWQTVEDARVEQDCEDNQAAGWIPWEDTFPSGHDSPLAHIACRCAMLMRRARY